MLESKLLQVLAEQQKQSTSYRKIVESLTRKDFFDAAIRICQTSDQIADLKSPLRRVFDPDEARDEKGRWTTTGDAASRSKTAISTPSVGYCKIVKQLCIVEATETLQTSDYGFQFWNAYNACMDRHGCLGVA